MDKQRLFKFLKRLNISELMTMLAIRINNNEVDVFGQSTLGEMMFRMFFSSKASSRCWVLALYDTPHWSVYNKHFQSFNKLLYRKQE